MTTRLAMRQYGERFPLGMHHFTVLDDLIVERDRVAGSSHPAELVSTATIEDLIQPAQVAVAVGFMKISTTNPSPMPSSTPADSVAPSSLSFSSGNQASLAPLPDAQHGGIFSSFDQPESSGMASTVPMDMSAYFDTNARYNDDSGATSRPIGGENALPQVADEWTDVSNFSFDPDEMLRLFGLAGGREGDPGRGG